VPLILQFIRELAEYERLSHQVRATEEKLRATLFGDRPVAEAVIASLDGAPVGYALFFPNYSTWEARPGCTWRTSSCVQAHAEKDWAAS